MARDLRAPFHFRINKRVGSSTDKHRSALFRKSVAKFKWEVCRQSSIHDNRRLSQHISRNPVVDKVRDTTILHSLAVPSFDRSANTAFCRLKTNHPYQNVFHQEARWQDPALRHRRCRGSRVHHPPPQEGNETELYDRLSDY